MGIEKQYPLTAGEVDTLKTIITGLSETAAKEVLRGIVYAFSTKIYLGKYYFKELLDDATKLTELTLKK